MSPQFTASRPDGRALHRVAAEFVAGLAQRGELPPDRIITHQRLAAEMGAVYPSSTYFQAVGKASDILQRSSHRSLVSVRGQGYQLVAGEAMVDKGRGQHGKARRQMSRALVTVRQVDEADITTAEGRVSLTLIRRGFSIIANVLSQQAEQLAEHDEEIASLKNSREVDRERLAALERQMRQLRGES